MGDKPSDHSWLLVSLLLPTAVYSILKMHPFWTAAGFISIFFLFIPRIFHTTPLPRRLTIAILSTFAPLVIGWSFSLDGWSLEVVEGTLQAWFAYFVSLAILVKWREWLSIPIKTSVLSMLGVLLTSSFSVLLAIILFLFDIYLGTSFIPSNSALMVRLLIILVGSSTLAGTSFAYLKARSSTVCSDGVRGRTVGD